MQERQIRRTRGSMSFSVMGDMLKWESADSLQGHLGDALNCWACRIPPSRAPVRQRLKLLFDAPTPYSSLGTYHSGNLWTCLWIQSALTAHVLQTCWDIQGRELRTKSLRVMTPPCIRQSTHCCQDVPRSSSSIPDFRNVQSLQTLYICSKSSLWQLCQWLYPL